jgi:hypothetical protein
MKAKTKWRFKAKDGTWLEKPLKKMPKLTDRTPHTECALVWIKGLDGIRTLRKGCARGSQCNEDQKMLLGKLKELVASMEADNRLAEDIERTVA